MKVMGTGKKTNSSPEKKITFNDVMCSLNSISATDNFGPPIPQKPKVVDILEGITLKKKATQRGLSITQLIEQMKKENEPKIEPTPSQMEAAQKKKQERKAKNSIFRLRLTLMVNQVNEMK
jgi:hypothetical protein